MSQFFAGLLTLVLIINCLLLIFLVLVQLPKKDAGAGLAFGSGAADALFGAGSGNALTKITKWATVAFLLICVVLGYSLQQIHGKGDANDIAKKIQQRQMQAPVSAPAPVVPQSGTPAATPPPAAAPSAVLTSTNATK